METNVYNLNNDGTYRNKSIALVNPKYKAETHKIGDKYLYNRNTSTLKKPLFDAGENEAEVFDTEKREWVKKPDFRGTWYNKETQEEKIIRNIGEIISDEYTKLRPGQFQKWAVDKWVIDEEKIKDLYKKSLSYKCKEEITTSNFQCNGFYYRCREEDQNNLNRVYLISVQTLEPVPIKRSSENDNDTFVFVNHAHSEILDVLNCMNAHIEEKRNNLIEKKNQVDNLLREDFDSDEEFITAIQSI